MVGARTRQLARRGISAAPTAAIPSPEMGAQACRRTWTLIKDTGCPYRWSKEHGITQTCLLTPTARLLRPLAMHATFLAGYPQNGTLTTCGMSVTALVEGDKYPGDLPDADAPTTMARSFTPPRTGNGRARPNPAPPQPIIRLTMTISAPPTAGRQMTRTRGRPRNCPARTRSRSRCAATPSAASRLRQETRCRYTRQVLSPR